MTIEDSKVTTLGPSTLVIGFSNVHDDGDSILIIILGEPMKSVDRIALDSAIGSFAKFDRFNMWYLNNPFFFRLPHIYSNNNINNKSNDIEHYN
jgi:hypothetical protein